jgi:predicted Fe-S protein YdhL (DUF1289 family)
MISPCIKVCQLDRARQICIGCDRTLDEIGGWAHFSDGERARIMEDLPARRRRRAAAQAQQQQ